MFYFTFQFAAKFVYGNKVAYSLSFIRIKTFKFYASHFKMCIKLNVNVFSSHFHFPLSFKR